MTSIDVFRSLIESILKQANLTIENPVPSSAEMELLLNRLRAYEQASSRILADIIVPRVEVVAGFFPNAGPESRMTRKHCAWWFGYCERFPASVKLDISCGHDEEIRNLYVIQELRMIPSFIRYERYDRLVQPLEKVNIEVVTQWVEDRLTAFVHAYLQLEATDRLQAQALATDPVCHMRMVTDDAAASLDYQGHRFYFCTQSCHDEFAAAPEHFAKIEMGH